MAWIDKPTILSKINTDDNYVFIDESGDIKDLKTVIKKISNGDVISVRDSNFVLNSVYLNKTNLRKLYISFSKLKNEFSLEKVVFHSVDIDNRKKDFSKDKIDEENFSFFASCLDEIIMSTRFRLIATAINKVDYIRKNEITDYSDARLIIEELYKCHFIKIESMLQELGVSAIVVAEETSDPMLDKIILGVFNKLRIKKKLIHSLKLYFTNKKAKVYPVGTELADLTSRSIYKIFREIEFVKLLKKAHNFYTGKASSLEFFERKIKKPAIKK